MSALARAFVSFAERNSCEKRFAGNLLTRLNEHSITAWTYLSEEGAIPDGTEILSFCKRMIDESALFIAVISDSTVHSEYTRAEVAHALRRQENEATFQIVPLLCHSLDCACVVCPSYAA